MAGALRPVVLLMLLASVLFVVDGFFDGVYPGGPAWFTGKYDNLAEISYVFAILNTVVAIMVARGSERSLQSRIGLSVFFLIERPVTAFALGPKPVESVITHFATAGVELLILVTALRVWRLGNAAPDVDTLFSLEGSSPATAKPEHDTGDGSGWIVYVFAAVALAVAARAMHGGKVALRALIGISLILFIERSFTPFSMREQDPIVLALHAVGAFVSLAVALVTASVIRGGPASRRASVPKLEAA